MCGEVKLRVCAQDAEVVEVLGRTAVASVAVLELAKVVERGNLLEGELERKTIDERETWMTWTRGTYAVIVLEVLQVLELVLTQCLRNIGVLNHIEHGLCLLLEPLVGRYGVLALLVKLCG